MVYDHLVLKWMKVVVLLAGALGVLAFFLPYFTFNVEGRKIDATPYQLASGTGDPLISKLVSDQNPMCWSSPDTNERVCDYEGLPTTHSIVPLYFLSTIAFLLTAAYAIWRKRMDVFGGLTVLAASLFAIGCLLHELNSEHHHGVLPSIGPGALLLGLSGLLAMGPAIAIIYWREPDPVPLFKIRVPQARVVRR